HAHVPCVRAQQGREHPQERRLAGAVGPEHDERLALLQRQRDVAQRLALTVVSSQPLDLERGHSQALDTCNACELCARAISSRTACSPVCPIDREPPSRPSRLSPARSSATGSGSPLTIPSK